MYNTIAMSFEGIENPEDVFTGIEHKMRENFIQNGGLFHIITGWEN